MHLRGKSFRFTAHYPDGRDEILLDVPRYDFNWQTSYRLAEPKLAPAGSWMICTGGFDNSAKNPHNPDPTQDVFWGDQTWQEMMVGTWGMALAEQDFSLGPPAIKRLPEGEFDVMFRYRPQEKAKAVYLAGTFNNWKATALPMTGPDAAGYFSVTQKLPAGPHEYKFVIDGTAWRQDPGNPRQVGFYRNSQIHVGDAKP